MKGEAALQGVAGEMRRPRDYGATSVVPTVARASGQNPPPGVAPWASCKAARQKGTLECLAEGGDCNGISRGEYRPLDCRQG